ncbi:MAG: hypothetical protein QF450_05555 [Rhodospirillales bacterium]|jgi:hypothetical protein|nr:hypothetical protein [Rhodospirillales bacterium]
MEQLGQGRRGRDAQGGRGVFSSAVDGFWLYVPRRMEKEILSQMLDFAQRLHDGEFCHATWIPFYGVCHEVFERGGQGVYARRLAPRLGDTCGGCHDVVVLEAERTRDFFDAGGAGRLLG